jgi:hypothetical protein
MDWWKVTWPEAGYQKDELYTMMLGLGVIGGMRAGGFDVAALKRGTGDFAKRWQAAIDRCRAKPDALFVDMIKPEGDYAKAMVAAMRDRPAGKAQ